MGRLAHLARRFFGALRGRPLTPVEQAEAAGLLWWQAEGIAPLVKTEQSIDGTCDMQASYVGETPTAAAQFKAVMSVRQADTDG